MDTSANNGPINIGQVLNQARIRRRLSIDQVSEALHIRREYILALEQNRWDDLPGEVYGQGFLKNYGRLVDLDGDALVEERRRQIGQPIDHPPILPMEPLARTGLYTHSTSRSLRSEPPPRKRRFSREPGEAPDYSSPSILVWLLAALAVLFVGGLIMLQHSSHHTHAHVATKPVEPSTTHHSKKRTTSASHHNTSASSVNISLQTTSQSGKLFYANYTVSKTPISVSLSFTNDCWVEGIVNGVPQPGKLYYGGQHVTFSGSQSVGVILGSHAVNVSVDGQNVPLPSPSYVLDMTFQG